MADYIPGFDRLSSILTQHNPAEF